ncbi:hypothetical protein SAMN05421664_1544 [Chryseobacterium soldanellicola]|uniref:Uncharacterized protein n=1 Tax=Chryseobacterium soldanellicola TaxID=311333 RepID=A0A1H1AQT0_9FLAO|nr:hypothetical protein [Chryseobacterium soldanellicola]SDQ42133.1 hypothetical protein SAMN05421664_1544 [Chryseobacterium soldanellicola]
MKKIFSVLIFSFCLSLFYSQSKRVFNRIDSLTSAKEVEEFIQNDRNKISNYLNVEDKINYDWYCQVIADSLDLKQNWEKADLTITGGQIFW